jgi:hypothetical protein
MPYPARGTRAGFIGETSSCSEPVRARDLIYKMVFNMAKSCWQITMAKGTLFAISLSVLFGLIQTPAYGEEDGSSYVVKGNSAYEQGNYAQAARSYRQAIVLRVDNGHVYYNLANALYRLEHIGSAVANYRRALEQMPSDPDVLSNLRLARKQTVDNIEADAPGLSDVLGRFLFLSAHMSRYQMTWIFVLSYLSFWVCFALSPMVKSAISKPVLGCLLVFLVFWSLMLFGTKPGRDGTPVCAWTPGAHRIRPAVVAVPEVKVYSGNSENFQVVFLLHDGAEVEAGEHRDSWVEILLPQSRRGWVKEAALEIL